MELVADILLICGALAATAYCVILSKRLRRFTDLEKGVGGAIAILSVQVDDMTKTLGVAQVSAAGSAQSLDQLTTKAEAAARRLELLVAAMHDIPDQDVTAKQPEPQKPTAEVTETPDQDSAQESEPQFHTQRNQMKEATG
ncbi:MAG: hypothetical protein V3V25_01060 [Paracoccaceae bacterium]